MLSLRARIKRIEKCKSGLPIIVWHPLESDDAVHIGRCVTERKPGETVEDLLDRAIRDFPDKRTKLVIVGWQDGVLL